MKGKTVALREIAVKGIAFKGIAVKGITKTKNAVKGVFQKTMALFKKTKDVVKSDSFQALLDLYMLRAAAVVALATSAAEQDTFNIILSAVLVGVLLLPMEKSFVDFL